MYQRQKNPVGIADRKVFVPRKVFARMYKIYPKINSKHCISLESFQTVWKVFRRSGRFLDCLESFQTAWKVSVRTAWKVSGQPGKLPGSLESFQSVWKVSRQSGKFPDSLESFRTVWKVSCRSNPWPSECLPRIKCTPQQCRKQSWSYHGTMCGRHSLGHGFDLQVWKVSGQSEQFLNSLKNLASLKIWHRKKTASYSVLCYIIICLENRVRSFSVCRETNLRTFGTNVSKTIYALCPESFCA